VFNGLIHFFSNNRIFTEAQNGVRKGKCTEKAIQSFTERIQEALDNEPCDWNIFLSNKSLQCIES
jgi:fructosamine-3-kinase